VKASAPGKIILFGEHAVVYGHPSLAVPVSEVQAEVEVVTSARRGIHIVAPGVNLDAELNALPLDHPLAVLIQDLFFTLQLDPFPDLDIHISSTIPVASGLGSGTAVSVAMLRALSSALQRPLSDEQINAQAFEVEKLHHGTPSGVDNTVVTYARPVYFIRGGALTMLKVAAPFTLVIGHTGIPAPTRQSVAAVRTLWESDPRACEVVFEGIGFLAGRAREAIESGAWRHLGPLMNENHSLLQRLTVSSVELDRLVQAARKAGALGAKLSGGGRGGNMIALAAEGQAQAIAHGLREAGAASVITTTVQPNS